MYACLHINVCISCICSSSTSSCVSVALRYATQFKYVAEVAKGVRVVGFPVRLGYAGTVQRIQGMTLEHVTLYLDRPSCRAAGYVALSRVEYDGNYLIAGPVHPRLFVPAM